MKLAGLSPPASCVGWGSAPTPATPLCYSMATGHMAECRWNSALSTVMRSLSGSSGGSDERIRLGTRCPIGSRSEEHTSELQSLMRISYAVFCLQKKQQVQFTRSSTSQIHTTQQGTKRKPNI